MSRQLVSRFRQWHLFDGRGQFVGPLATRIAPLLLGKHKPTYTPAKDEGDTVVVVNCEHVQFPGKRELYKQYWRHSTKPGNLKWTPVTRLRQTHPERILAHAVRGMLPKNKLRDVRMDRLKIYKGPAHKHHSQLGEQAPFKDPELERPLLELQEFTAEETKIKAAALLARRSWHRIGLGGKILNDPDANAKREAWQQIEQAKRAQAVEQWKMKMRVRFAQQAAQAQAAAKPKPEAAQAETSSSI